MFIVQVDDTSGNGLDMASEVCPLANNANSAMVLKRQLTWKTLGMAN
jgi:hypothetical protein